ncbi:MAG: hypothetical protein WDO13_21465 [Verrucomicrobiota bacterium]
MAASARSSRPAVRATTISIAPLQPGPRPDGATAEPLVGCGADGFHSAGTRIGPDIEDCAFRGIFLDDCIAIHGTFGQVTAVNGADLTIRGITPVVGEPLRISDTHGFFAQATCVAVTDLGNGSVTATLAQDLHVPLDPKDTDKRGGDEGEHAGRLRRGLQDPALHPRPHPARAASWSRATTG